METNSCIKSKTSIQKSVYASEKWQRSHNSIENMQNPAVWSFKRADILRKKNMFRESCIQPGGIGVVQSVGISHIRGQLSEWLAPAPTHSKQQCIAQGLTQDAADTAHMLNGVHEEHKFHLGGTALIVVFHVLIHHFHQLHDIIKDF